jgi:thiol-disulfide isomerase/thioredoxin
MFGDAKRAIGLVLVCAFTFAGCGGSNPSTTNDATAKANSNAPVLSRPPATAFPMPPVKPVKSATGWTLGNSQHVKLSDYQGKVVVLDFYATWCEPCRDSIPHLVELQKRYGSQGLQVIGLNVGGEDDYDKVPDFARKFKIEYPLGIPDSELENSYLRDNAIPQTIIIDRGGKLAKKFVGYDESMAEELERVIQSSLSGTATRPAGP